MSIYLLDGDVHMSSLTTLEQELGRVLIEDPNLEDINLFPTNIKFHNLSLSLTEMPGRRE